MSGLELGQQALSYDPQHLPLLMKCQIQSTTGTGRHNLIRKCPSDLHILAKTLRALLEHVRNHICKYIYLPEGMFMYFSVTQTWEVPLNKAF